MAAAREHVLDRPQQALDLALALVARDATDIDSLEVAALAADRLGRIDDAERHFHTILTLDPEARWARDDLARMLIAAGRRVQAERVLRDALSRDDGHADAHMLLGVLFAERDMLVEACWHFERALALAGRRPELLVNLGRARLRRGDLQAAGGLARYAIGMAPRSLGALMLAADVAERGGDQDAAHGWLERAGPIAAAEGRDIDLARATLLAGGEQWREALAMLDRAEPLSGAARLLRGRLRDRAGRSDEAWEDFVGGKAGLARPHDRGAADRRFAALAGAFSADLPCASLRRDVPQPIFIMGAPRSGTTMTEQLLAAHSRVRAGGELPFVAEMAELAAKLLGEDFPAHVAKMRTADMRHLPALLRDHYLARAEIHGLTETGAEFFTDKMPLNEQWLPLIRLAFPHAPLILVRRHPLDVLVSAMSHDMTHGDNAFHDPADAAHHLAATGRLVRLYRERLGIVPHRFGYERFVADPAGETAALMAHVGLAAEPAQTHFHTLDRHAPTPSYAQVREPLHDRSIGRWRRYAPQLAPYRALLADLMAEDGYSA